MSHHPNHPSHFGVTLRAPSERARWNKLIHLKMDVSRYPCGQALWKMGIDRCFWEVELATAFAWEAESFRELTLEFLSTLHVYYTPRRIVSKSTFRVRNQDREMGIADINQLFESEGQPVLYPEEYDENQCWHVITIQDDLNTSFVPARAKVSEVRNLVLRFILKALSNHIFGRTEMGNILRDELFALWCILKKRKFNIGHYVVRHLERQANKSKGGLAVGGLVTMFAAVQGVDYSDLDPLPGERLITFNVLRGMNFLQVDESRQGYFTQRHGDYFLFPDPQNTYVNGWTYRDNWLMNTPLHQAIIASKPHG